MFNDMYSKVTNVEIDSMEQQTIEETTPKFKRAKEVAVFSQDEGEENFNPLNKQYKGIANEENPTQVFNIVGINYKIAQHDDVCNLVTQAVKDHGLDQRVSVEELNDGARIHGRVTFPEINFNLNGRSIQMRLTFDNSYNATTGVRMIVGARCVKRGIIYYVRESYATFYHRHTKGLDINEITKKVGKGIQAFQNEIRQKFERYSNNNLDNAKVREFLKELDNSVIPDKYLESIVKKAQNAQTQWDIYEASCEVLSNVLKKSPDRQRDLMNKMDRKIQNNAHKLK